MRITPDRTPVNSAAAKSLSRHGVPANTVADALDLIASNITGDLTRQKIAETLAKGLDAKYSIRIRKCPNKPGCNVVMTFQEIGKGFTVAHFTDLA